MNSEKIKQIFVKPGDERAVLSYSINNIDNFYTVCSKMEDSDFLSYDHSLIFVLLKTLHNRGVKKFDLAMLINESKEQGILELIGGTEYLQSVKNMKLSKGNFEVFLHNVLEASTKYKLYGMIEDDLAYIVDNAKDGDSSSDLIGKVEGHVLELSTTSKAIKEPIDVADKLEKYIEERKDHRIEMVGLSTGYPILDKQIDGLIPGTVFVVSARKKMGKSALLSNIAVNTAYRLNEPVLYIDTEMTFNEWLPRVAANMSGVKERTIKHGGYNKEDYDNIINKCIRLVKKGKLFHEYMPGYSVEKITALYKKYKAKENIGLAVFDYLKEPESTNIDTRRKEYQILGDVTTKLKDLAGELEIPVVTAVQINRAGDVADSDRIARYADIIAQWMKKTDEELEGGGEKGGTYKLVIRDTRRGGGTSEEGIGYKFFKPWLTIKEVPANDQLLSAYNKEEVIDDGSDMKSGDYEEELS